MNGMDTTELKKKLAKLKKEYKHKETVLKKVERRAHSKAHVKRRVEEEAKKTAESECQVNVRKPVKVKFEEEVTRTPCGEVNQTKHTEPVNKNNAMEENSQNSCYLLTSSQSVDTALNVAIIEDESQQQLIESEDEIVKLDSETRTNLLETVDKIKEDHNNPNKKAMAESNLADEEEKSRDAENVSNLTLQESDVCVKVDNPANTHVLQKAKTRESMIDFSFLDEESDLYSQIKSRKRRSRESPSLSESLSQLSVQPKKKARTPKARTPKSTLCQKSAQKEADASKLQDGSSVESVSVKEIFEKISSSSDLTSQEEFNLPTGLATDVKPVDCLPSTCSTSSEKASPRTYHSLPADIKPGEVVSPLVTPTLAFNSQVDFQSEKSSSRKGKVTRKIKPYRQKKCSTPKITPKEPADANDDYPFRNYGMIKTQEPVLHVECCADSILTCTSSAVTLWSQCDGVWTADFTFSTDADETFEGCKMMASGSHRAVVVATRSTVSFLYRLVQIKGQETTVLYEVPFTQSSQVLQFCQRTLMCCVSATDLLLAVPASEQRLHTQLTHVHLTKNLKDVTARRKLPIVGSKLVSLSCLKKVPGKFAVGTSAESVYIWNLDACLLVKEVHSSYKIKHCAGAVAEQGVIFLACIVDEGSGDSGGLFAMNPATGAITLVTKLESEVLWKNKGKRWQCLAWHNRFMCVSASQCTAVFSAYGGHLVSHTSGMGRLSCVDITRSHAVFASKSTVLVFTVSKKL